MRKKPDLLAQFMKVARARLAKVRADSLTWRADVVEGLDSMAERDRSLSNLRAEARSRYTLALTKKLSDSGVGQDAATRSKDSKDYERLQRYQESKSTLIASGFTESEAEPLAQASANKWRSNIIEKVREAQREAKAEADEWHDKAKAAIPTRKERMLASIRTLEAIASAFPAEVRGRMGSVIKLASLETDEARLKEITRKLDILESATEQELRKTYTKQLGELIKKSQPKGKAGDKPKGKIGADAHEWFAGLEEAFEMNASEAAKEIASLQGRLAAMSGPHVTPEQQAEIAKEEEEINRRIAIIGMFGGWEEMTAEEMEQAIIAAETIQKYGRKAWMAKVQARREQDEARREEAFKNLGNRGTPSEKSAMADERKKHPVRAAVDPWFRFFMSPDVLTKDWLGADSGLAKYFEEQELRASLKNRDAVNLAERELQGAIDRALGGKTDRRSRDNFIYNAIQPTNTATILRGYVTHEEKIDIEAAQIAVKNNAKGFTAAQLDELRAQVDLHEAAIEAGTRAGQVKTATYTVEDNKGERAPVTVSPADASYWLALYAQEKLRPALKRVGIDEQSVAELLAAEGPALRAVRGWMVQKLKADHAGLNAIYAELNGVNLPQIGSYFPARFVHDGNVESPETGGALSDGGMKTGALHSRKKHVAQLATDFDGHSINLFTVFQRHIAEMEYWKAYANHVRELKATFRNGQVVEAFKARHGDSEAVELSRWVESVEKGGLATGYMNEKIAGWMRRMLQGTASAAMGLKLGTHMVNMTSALTAYLDPALKLKEINASYGRVIAGKAIKSPKEIFASETMQRRLQAGTNVLARVAKDASAMQKPGFLADVNLLTFNSIGFVDARAGSIAAAVSYDANYRKAKAAGLPDDQANEEATFRMEQTIARVMQPVEQSSKSLSEVGGGMLWKLFTMFSSEARQKAGLEATAIRNLATLKLTRLDARTLIVNHVLLGTAAWLLKSIARDLQKDDDDGDEAAWEWEDWLASVVVGPLSGIPLIGASLNWAVASALGANTYFDEKNPVLAGFQDIERGARGLWESDDGADGFVRDFTRTLSGVSELFGGPTAGAVAVLANGLSLIYRLADNASTE